MKLNILFLLLFTLCSHAEEAIDLTKSGNQLDKKVYSEGMQLEIHSDGRLFCDGGAVSTEKLSVSFKKWREGKVEPVIEFILYPSLKSNSDLEKIKDILDFLESEHVNYHLIIKNKKDKVPSELTSK